MKITDIRKALKARKFVSKKLDSSMLLEAKHIGGEENVLILTFSQGATYAYDGVPRSEWVKLCMAESAGKFVNRHIKPVYSVKKINL